MLGDEQPRDRKGQRRLTRERRAEVVKEYEASGLTQAEFARRAGLNAEGGARVEATRGGEVGLGEELVELGALHPSDAGLGGELDLGERDEIAGDALDVGSRRRGLPSKERGAQRRGLGGAESDREGEESGKKEGEEAEEGAHR